MGSLRDWWENIVRDSKASFLVGPDHRMSYGDLAQDVSGWLQVFDDHRVKPGSRFLLMTSNEPAACSAVIAAMLDGIVPVMLTPDTHADREASIAASVQPSLIVRDADLATTSGEYPVFRIGTTERKSRFSFLRGGGQRVLALPKGKREPSLPTDPDGLAYLLFTSGTTRAPVGVMISRRNLFANLATLTRLFGYDRDSRIFNDMVLAHADGLIQGPILALANGCTVIRSGGFTVQAIEPWLNRVRQERASHFVTVPTIWSMIDRYAEHDDYFDAPECRVLMSVAARLDPSLWARVEKRFSRPLFNQYGLTETVVSALYAGKHPEMGAHGTIGRPVDCEARVAHVGDDRGKAGELQLRGDNVFVGYWQDPGRSAETFTSDGWLRTGDLVEPLPDGSFDITGRIKTVIMSAGFLIRPEEIDEVLMRHPAVAQATTVALPNADFGEIPVSAVVLDHTVDEAELTDFARAHLESLKVPKRIIALEAIPRGDAGKAQVGPLREILQAKLRAEATPPKPNDDVDAAVCLVAADVFRVPVDRLGPGSKPQEVPGWDSFSQISLILAVEEHFKIRIPTSKAAGMRTLGEFMAAVKSLRK